MAKNVPSYKGVINEFVDWATGIDSIKNENVTDNLPVGGNSIRLLILSRLKAPFYTFYDENNALYRLFSSEDSFKLWLSDTELYSNLILFEFNAPTPFTASFTGLSEDTKYIRKGDTSNTVLSFYWNISGKNLDNYSDSVTINYSFNNNGVRVIPVKYNHSLLNVVFDMSPYLLEGTNTVVVSLTGNTTNASTSISFNVEVLNLELTSTFAYYSPITLNVNNATPFIDFPYTITGSGTYGRVVEFFVDGISIGTDLISSLENTYTTTRQILNNYSTGKHNLLVLAHITILDTNYYSNLLYMDFVVEGFSDTTIKYILLKLSFNSSTIYKKEDILKLLGVLYEDSIVSYGYYSSDPYNSQLVLKWTLQWNSPTGLILENTLTTVTAKVNTPVTDLVITPEVTGLCYIRAYAGDTLILEYDYYVYNNANNIRETSGYIMKLSAKGRSNSEPANLINTWTYHSDLLNRDFTSELTRFLWNNNSGWYNNSLTLSGGALCYIDCGALDQNTVGSLDANNTLGVTFEIEFETFNTTDSDKPIIYVGDLEHSSILITPNKAFITNNTGIERIKTNYKEGEKIKLAFILNASNGIDSLYLFIINNGILERGVKVPGENFNASGGITIDGSGTGIKIYSIKVYNKAISYNEEFYNWVLDSGNITKILNDNNVYDTQGNISEPLCEQKLDVITITGPLDTVISAKDKLAECAVTLDRISLALPEFSFSIKNCRIRRHGQSTLDYPIPSFKIWSNSYEDAEMTDYNGAVIYKGRYAFKKGAIPSKKWVLLANYSDSSGVHNGALQRMITDTWYDAKIGASNDYKLRSLPQLYTTSTGEFLNRGWYEEMKTPFPYKIRVSPDSFPCVVFWRKTDLDSYSFLGQYVFMDDKKSDYVYGERSIYNLKDDPFRLKANAPSKKELVALWNNENTLLIEVISVNTPYVDYTSNDSWDSTQSNPSDTVRGWLFNWENHFELIYPEVEDIYNLDKEDPAKHKDTKDTSILKNKVQPFSDWVAWLVSTYKVDNGGPKSLAKFKNEAPDHLDLYKMAAYYIYVLRFGLVDSLERNALIKTYDGKHFHYEPWDMDIALGNKNTGGIAFDPPVDRNTVDPASTDNNNWTYWISGRAGKPGTSSYTSNWLFDALEAWTTERDSLGIVTREGWIDSIVPTVAEALYQAGLTYANVMKMFDEEYLNKWCERMYNDSGHFKYIESSNGDLLQFLQGARTSHRHWWTKASFDYYDAKWACGDFRKNNILFATNTVDTGLKIKITPSTSTYFSLYSTSLGKLILTSELTTKDVPIEFTLIDRLSTKDPRSILGSLYIKELDMSEITQNLERLNLGGLYSEETGTNIVSLNAGLPWDWMLKNSDTSSIFNFKSVLITNYSNLTRLESLYLRGYRNVSTFNSIIASLPNLRNFYAAGSGLTTFKNSNVLGNQFILLELPDTILIIELYSSSWEDMKFYHTNIGKLVGPGDSEWESNPMYDDDGNPIVYSTDTYLDPTPIEIPKDLHTVIFSGNTGLNACTINFILKWIHYLDSISTDKYDAFADKTLIVDDAYWTWTEETKDLGVSYNDLMLLARIPNIVNTLKGYIKLTDEEPTAAQLTNIMSIFGEYVFSLGSSALTIDYIDRKLVLSVPSPGYTDKDGNICLQEGHTVKLLASYFSLTTEERKQQWGIINPITSGWESSDVNGSKLSIDGILEVPETDVEARVINIGVFDLTSLITKIFPLNITKRTYPKEVKISSSDSEEISGSFSIGLNSVYTFSPSYFGLTIYPKSTNDDTLDEYSGTIKSYQWEFTNENNRILLKEGTDLHSRELKLEFSRLLTNTENETIKLTVTYANGLTLVASAELIMFADNVILSDSPLSNSSMYRLLRENNYPSANLGYYSVSDLGKFSDFSFTNKDNANNSDITAGTAVYNFKAIGGGNTNGSGINILLYLTNVTNIDVSGLELLRQIVFNDTRTAEEGGVADWNCDWFLTINLSGCSSLSDVDVTPVINLLTINMSNTTAGFKANLNNILLSTVTLGTPTTIDIQNVPNLTSENIILDSSELTSIKLKNLLSKDTFKKFTEILN